MSTLLQLNEAMKVAMKARDAQRLSAIRMALAACKNKQIELGHELDDAEVVAVLSALVKQRRDSIEAYRGSNRDDLAAKEEQELAVLQEFLPRPLSEAELAELIEAALRETAASSMKDMGRVMKIVTARATGRADGRLVSDMVKARLQG